MKKIVWIFLINFGLFPIFLDICYLGIWSIVGDGASNNSKEAEAWWLYVKFVAAH